MARVWQTFLGMECTTAKKVLSESFARCGVVGEWQQMPDSFLLGSMGDSYCFTAKKPVAFDIGLQKATADPISRGALGFTSAGTGYMKGLSKILVRPVNVENKAQVKQLLQDFANHIDTDPWSVGHHPRLKYAWIMRLVIKSRWKKMLQA